MLLLRICLLLLVATCALASVQQAVVVGGLLKAAALKGAVLKAAAIKGAVIKGLALKHIVIPAVSKHIKENKHKYEALRQKLFGGLGGGHHEEHEVHYYHDYHDHESPKHYEAPKHYETTEHHGYSHGSAYQEREIHSHHIPHYSYKYGVEDYHSGDHKSAWESRLGDYVKGEYTVKEPDGTKRIVSYHSDPKGGFVADVKKVGYPHYGAHSHYISHRADDFSAPALVQETAYSHDRDED
ncbi:histidine-rich glycoprotein-like [Phlebotomus argentipes]|uniref:histidine-rich glycoprotein-like n=1 Tax=Phlebotomus argentipes TaxID=94469 RepID=UPI0028935A41|nr:histidine-rich glycoprotein-like [Phlebotomus argentipes]